MEEFIQFSAKTKNEAITKACIELGVSSDQLEIEVVSEGSSGFFGIGSKPAIIKARKIKRKTAASAEGKNLQGASCKRKTGKRKNAERAKRREAETVQTC